MQYNYLNHNTWTWSNHCLYFHINVIVTHNFLLKTTYFYNPTSLFYAKICDLIFQIIVVSILIIIKYYLSMWRIKVTIYIDYNILLFIIIIELTLYCIRLNKIKICTKTVDCIDCSRMLFDNITRIS